MTTTDAVNWSARIPKWRLAAVLAATLLLHVAVLHEAERGLGFDLPAPVLPIQAELFKLPAPIAVRSRAVRARPANRAITLPAPRSAATSSSSASAAAPSANVPATSADATPIATEAKDPEPQAAASQPNTRADAEQPAAPAPGTSSEAPAVAAPADSNSSAQASAAAQASSPRAAANESASDPLRAVVVDFPKLGRFSSDVTYLRGWLRFFGTTVIEWRINANVFQARSETHDDRGSEWLILTSQGRVLPDVGVAPELYTEKVRNRAVVSAYLDLARGRVTFSSSTKEFPWVRGTQDRLSFMAQLALVAQAFPERLVPEQPILLPVAGPRDVRLYDLRIVGRETIGTPSGVYDAIKIDRFVGPEQKNEPRIELWLVPELHYLPVRTRTTFADGGVLETLLRQVTLEN